MKRILITGANSYIGMSFEKYMSNFKDYSIDTLDMLDPNWKDYDFSKYDSIFHVAGIAHIKETKENAQLYYKVNRDITIEVAKIAKSKGVKQFVFLSSMSVYGIEVGIITKETEPNPNTNYGKSKLEAEIGLNELRDDNFKVAILRPPMVYGEGCKGNYKLLTKFALMSPIFPDIENKRSMIHIDKLCEYVKKYIDENANDVFYPQDDKYVCTTEMVKEIAKSHNKNIKTTKIFNPIIKNIKYDLFNKVFGDLIYKI